MESLLLQPILGTCKDNPAFCVMSAVAEPKDLHVYFGLALLERIKSGADSFTYKNLVGRLYNADIKRINLVKAFGHPLSTIQRWGDAVKSGDAEKMAKAFAGQGKAPRMTSEIGRFIRSEFRRIYPGNPYSYSKQILDRVEHVFGESFSSETLRPLFNEEKTALSGENNIAPPSPATAELGMEDGQSPGGGGIIFSDSNGDSADLAGLPSPITAESGMADGQSPGSGEIIFSGSNGDSADLAGLPSSTTAEAGMADGQSPGGGEIIFRGSKENTVLASHSIAMDMADKKIEAAAAKKAKTCDSAIFLSSEDSNIRKYSLSAFNIEGPLPGRFGVNHLGLVIFLPIIRALGFPEEIWNQWLSSILLGAVNVEQSGRLDFQALELMLGKETISSSFNQQVVLGKLATADNTTEILRANSRLCGAPDSAYFYYDPHGVPYTGMKDILKGWCGSAGRIAKINYQDFIHTDRGCPVHLDIFDNYLGLRERFADNVDVFLKQVIGRETATFIVDRGIYGKEAMSAILARGIGLVTWEQGYKKTGWKTDTPFTEFIIRKPRNSSSDMKLYRVRFQADPEWSKIPGFRRLIVKILPVSKNGDEEAEVSILSSGGLDDQTAVYAMLDRWIQENDFKYMIRHFGINQITSYKSRSYLSIEALLAEKKAFSEIWQTLSKNANRLKDELQKLLLKKHMSGQTKEQPDTRICELTKELEKAREEKQGVEQHVDKAAKLIGQGKERLDTDKKVHYDALRITARNIFYMRLWQFRETYDNRRNDHQLLRELSTAHGYVTCREDRLVIELNPTRNYPPAQEKAVMAFLEIMSKEINERDKGMKPVKITLVKNKGGRRYPMTKGERSTCDC